MVPGLEVALVVVGKGGCLGVCSGLNDLDYSAGVVIGIFIGPGLWRRLSVYSAVGIILVVCLLTIDLVSLTSLLFSSQAKVVVLPLALRLRINSFSVISSKARNLCSNKFKLFKIPHVRSE